jgi:Ni2+-binding GTPase involved in maturation of urease and hydrogenase
MTHKVPLDIVSGFLGAGKTTLLLKMLKERTTNEKLFILAKDPLYENQIASEPASSKGKRFSAGRKQQQSPNHVKRHSGPETFQKVS